MISRAAAVRIVAIDPEIEAFIPLFPQADLTDPLGGALRRAMA